jgi:hypothetical protein
MMIAPLQLIDYRVELLAHKRFDAVPVPDGVEMGVALGLEFDAAFDEARDAQCLTLVVHYNEEGVPEDVRPYVPYEGRTRVEGWLRWVDDEAASRDDAQHLLLSNGLSMLYGLARASIADLTAGSKAPRLVLPSLSFRPIAEDWLRERAQGERAQTSQEAPGGE